MLVSISLLALASPALAPPAPLGPPLDRQGPSLPAEQSGGRAPVRLQLDPLDQLALTALGDDGVAGNAAGAYAHLHERGLAARPCLRQGLAADDWQRRLLCAVLLAQLPANELDLEPTGRILVGHLSDNSIRGDALLAGHALVALGDTSLPFLEAAAWHPEPQLADLCKRLSSSIRSDRKRPHAEARAAVALARLQVDLAWTGKARPVAPKLAPPPLTPAVRLEHALQDLGADLRKGNAVMAEGYLSRVSYARQDPSRSIPSHEQQPSRAEYVAVLRRALVDKDRQRRTLAASILFDLDHEPEPALLRALVESLEQDEFGSSRTLIVANAEIAAQYALRHPEAAIPYLRAALPSPQETVRVRAAALLAQVRAPVLGDYVPLLIDHLASNDLEEDATLCGQSLAMLGPAALPWLDIDPVDGQQAHYLAVVRGAIALREADPKARLPFSWGGMYHLDRRRPSTPAGD